MPQLPHPALPHAKANESVRRDPATCDPTVPVLRAPIHVMYCGLPARSRKQALVRLRAACCESLAALRTLARECRWSVGLWLRPRTKTRLAGERVRRSEPRAAFVMTVLGLASGVLLMKNLSRLDLLTPHVAAETMVGHALAASAVQPKSREAPVVSQLASMCMAGPEVVTGQAVAKVAERHEPLEKTSKQGATSRHEKAATPHATAPKHARDAESDVNGSVVRKTVLRHEAAQAERAERAMAHFAQKARAQEPRHERAHIRRAASR